MKYNAILVEKLEMNHTKTGLEQYVGDFLIALGNNTYVRRIKASQLCQPIPAKVGDEIILDIDANEKYGKTFYNIKPATSYVKKPFPVILRSFYNTTLDAAGRDPFSRVIFPKYPYADVTICWLSNYTVQSGKVQTQHDYILDAVGGPIDYTAIQNAAPNLTRFEDESDQEYLLECLRDYLPDEEHPNKHLYTPAEIFKFYREVTFYDLAGCTDLTDMYSYGSDEEHCICGHYIEDVRWCEYVSPLGTEGIHKPILGAIGNCCIEQMAYGTRLYTRLLHDIVTNCRRGKFETERDVSKKNGFGDKQMRFLQLCVLTPDEYAQLEKIVTSRTKQLLDNGTKRTLHHIAEFYHANYNFVFDAAVDKLGLNSTI